MTKYIILLLALMASASAFAQKPDVTENFDINGIKIESVVNDSIIRSKLGVPTNIEDLLSGEIIYSYGETGLYVVHGVLASISVRDSRFPVMTYIFDGGIRVGDNASEVKAKIRQKTRSEIRETDKGFMAGDPDFHVSFGVSNGKITLISHHIE